jgi:hypothetical protein
VVSGKWICKKQSRIGDQLISDGGDGLGETADEYVSGFSTCLDLPVVLQSVDHIYLLHPLGCARKNAQIYSKPSERLACAHCGDQSGPIKKVRCGCGRWVSRFRFYDRSAGKLGVYMPQEILQVNLLTRMTPGTRISCKDLEDISPHF